MDSLTHIFLGSALAQSAFARRLGHPRAFLIGSLAATFPDFDVFLHAHSQVASEALHRHFMHSLLIVPLLAALSVLPFLLHKKSRPLLLPLYLAALLACASHSLLDSLTSYGTMIFWPFSYHRFSLDIIPVIDPLYTLPLILGTLFAWRRKSFRPALIALIVSTAYLGLATLQHARAQSAQRDLLAARRVDHPLNPRVLPQVGTIISYRSIYISDNRIYADAFHVPPFSAPVFKPGTSLPLLTPADLRAPTSPDAPADLATFADLADGFLARSPKDPLLLSDQRYTYTPEGTDPVWGIQLENTGTPLFRIAPRYNYFGILLRDLFHPQGYGPLPLAQQDP